MAKKRKNANGEGTIYQAKSGPRKGQWTGQLTVGTNQKQRNVFENRLHYRCITQEIYKPFGKKLKPRNPLRGLSFLLEPTSGVEPETSALPRRRSTY